MKLVTAAQMRAIDRETIDKYGIPGATLMETAGRGISDYILTNLITGDHHSVAIFCGKGNNGGDGLVVARYLLEAEIPVTVYMLGATAAMTEDARLNYDRALRVGVPMQEVSSLAELPETLSADIIVDAIFGTGFTGTPNGVAALAIDYINRQGETGREVVAVDLPSGLNADTGLFEGSVVRATQTCTLGLPKYGLYLSPGRELAGRQVAIIPIGIPDEPVAAMGLHLDLTTEDDVKRWLPERKPDGHKGDFGKLFVLAGSTGLTGAACLAAQSAMRTGTGLVKIGCPSSLLPIISLKTTEPTSVALPEVKRYGALALRSLGEIRRYMTEHDAIVIGPGIGKHHETRELIRRLIDKLEIPAILDADGLNAFEGVVELLEMRSGNGPLVITPHPGEFQRLTNMVAPLDIHARSHMAIEYAKRMRVTLVLKGSPTLVASEEGACYLNPTGNSGMATGGSGDVLSGMIGALLAQSVEPFKAAVTAVYLHGAAGDIAADMLTERAMIAGDMIDCLPEAFMALEKR
ncbi:MAG: NAD(P)H-hydrate dehydratase [bacterium]|nr:NAD(P)H-hydrate dehydratase [bacterium]